MPVGMKPICLNEAPSTTCTPSASMSATKKILPSGEMRMSCGMPRDGADRAAELASSRSDL